jgi:hypothetical protein
VSKDSFVGEDEDCFLDQLSTLSLLLLRLSLSGPFRDRDVFEAERRISRKPCRAGEGGAVCVDFPEGRLEVRMTGKSAPSLS